MSNEAKTVKRSARHPAIADRPICELEYHWKRTEPRSSVLAVVATIREFGFAVPLLIKESKVHSGSKRLEAAKLLGMTSVPCIERDLISSDQARDFFAAAKFEEWGECGMVASIRQFDARGMEVEQ